MAYVVGIALALAVSLFARRTGFDRDRAFYPAVVVVVASYYLLFAAMGGSAPTLVVESIVMIGFVLVAVLGFKRNAWLVVGGLAAHGAFDAAHDLLLTSPGVPAWWPAFCLTFDASLAVLLALDLLSARTRRLQAEPDSPIRPC